jgi:phenylacetate-CoA ligase
MKRTALSRDWDKLPRKALRKAQMAALRHYLKRVIVPFSPHYRKLFREQSLDVDQFQSFEDLQRLPFASKRDLLSTPESPNKAVEFLIKPDEASLLRRPSTIWRTLTAGKETAVESLEHEFRPVILTSTTGRSSEPVPFLYTSHDLDILKIAGRRMMQLCDSSKDNRHLNVFPFAPHLAFWQMHYAGLGFNTFCLSTGGGKTMGTEGNVSIIEKIKPDAIIGMPTFIYHLFQSAAEKGVRWSNLKRVVLGGEKAPRGLRTKLRDLAAALGSTDDLRILSTYGFTEAKLACPECAFGTNNEPTGFHLYPDLGIVEVVDPDTGQQLGDGEPGEIVYTPLDSRGTVILRYRTGDIIEGGLTYEPCPGCHRQMPRLVGRISRVSNRKEMRLDKLKGTLVDFNELESILDDLDGLGAWQIELRKRNDDPMETDELVVHAEPLRSAAPETLQREIEQRMMEGAEIKPNRVVFHDAEVIRKLQGVGKELKETRIVDRRPEIKRL